MKHKDRQAGVIYLRKQEAVSRRRSEKRRGRDGEIQQTGRHRPGGVQEILTSTDGVVEATHTHTQKKKKGKTRKKRTIEGRDRARETDRDRPTHRHTHGQTHAHRHTRTRTHIHTQTHTDKL